MDIVRVVPELDLELDDEAAALSDAGLWAIDPARTGPQCGPYGACRAVGWVLVQVMPPQVMAPRPHEHVDLTHERGSGSSTP